MELRRSIRRPELPNGPDVPVGTEPGVSFPWECTRVFGAAQTEPSVARAARIEQEQIALCFRHGHFEDARGTTPATRTDRGSYHCNRTVGAGKGETPRASPGVDDSGIGIKAAVEAAGKNQPKTSEKG